MAKVDFPTGGFDVTLLTAADQKYLCPVCQKILREPRQTSCGHRACASCLENRLINGRGQCPAKDCLELLTKEKLFRDGFAEREIMALQVLCNAVTQGCPWQGQLKDLEEHTEDCRFSLVKCSRPGCTELVQRQHQQDHESKECRFRLVSCEHCNAPVILHTLQAHYEQCDYYPMICNQGCGETLPRMRMRIHIDEHCPHTEHPCKFQFASCEFQGRRGELKAHEAAAMAEHLSQLADLCRIQQRCLSKSEQEISHLRQELKDMRSGGSSLAPFSTYSVGSRESLAENIDRGMLAELYGSIDDLRQKSCSGVLVWKVTNVSKLREEARRPDGQQSIYSPPFYSSQAGYKMRARLYPNGDGKGRGTHMSLFFLLMKGEYDSLLRWPFSARVTFTLLDQSDQRSHAVESFIPDLSSSSFQRPQTDMNVASGCPLFIPLTNLRSRGYVRNDTMFIRVSVDARESKGVDRYPQDVPF